MRTLFTTAVLVSTLGAAIAGMFAFSAGMQLGEDLPTSDPARLLTVAGLIGVLVTPLVAALGIAGALALLRPAGPGAAMLPMAVAPLFAAGSVALLAMAQASIPVPAPLPRAPLDLTQLERFFESNPDLVVLDLRGRGLATVPTVVAMAPVETLDLRDNPLTELPDSLLENTVLRRLLVGGTAIPPEEQQRFLARLEARGRTLRVYF